MPRVLRCLPSLCCAGVLALSLAPAVRAQEYVTPNENLVVEGVPKIPRALAEEADRYSNARSAGLGSWHPVRREMLISTRFADVPQVHLVKMPRGARTQLTFFGDRAGGASFEPVKGDFFLFTKDVGGGEFFQFYRYDVATGAITLLTDGKSRNVGHAWAHDGSRIAFSSTRRNGEDLDFWVMDPRKPESAQMVLENKGGGWGVLDWSPDNKQLLIQEEISVNETYLYTLDLATRQKRLLTPKGSEKVAYGGAAFAKSGKGVYLTTDKGSEFQRLAYMDLATGKLNFLTTAIPWDVDEFAQSEDGKRLAFFTNEEGVSVLHYLDPLTNKVTAGPKLPLGVAGGLAWRRNAPEFGFTLNTAHSPSDVFSVDAVTGKLTRWTESETGGLNAASFSTPSLIRWKSFDGRMISGFLYPPAEKFKGQKRPVIVDIHGGPEGQSRPDFLGAWNYYLNELGIAIVEPNVRGSTGFGKSFSQLDNGFLREDSYKDINALLDWIGQQSGLDASRVMVTGGSYGGFMTLAVATTYNDRIRCSVDVVGPSNLVTFLEHTSGYRRDLRRVEYGDERDPKMREFLERIAPANKTKNITKPLFVVQGFNDPRVPYTESEQMVKKVRENGTPVWYLLAKDEGHGFGKKKNRDFEFYATVEFVKEFLLK